MKTTRRSFLTALLGIPAAAVAVKVQEPPQFVMGSPAIPAGVVTLREDEAVIPLRGAGDVLREMLDNRGTPFHATHFVVVDDEFRRMEVRRHFGLLPHDEP